MKLNHGISETQLAIYELETNSQVLSNWEVMLIIALSMMVGAILLMVGHFMFYRTLEWLSNQEDG